MIAGNISDKRAMPSGMALLHWAVLIALRVVEPKDPGVTGALRRRRLAYPNDGVERRELKRLLRPERSNGIYGCCVAGGNQRRCDRKHQNHNYREDDDERIQRIDLKEYRPDPNPHWPQLGSGGENQSHQACALRAEGHTNGHLLGAQRPEKYTLNNREDACGGANSEGQREHRGQSEFRRLA